MILDSSSVVALLLEEDEARAVAGALGRAESLRVGAPTLVETGMVLTGKLGLKGRSLLSDFLLEEGVEILPFTEGHWSVAYEAFRRFGKRRHPAALNLGDCFTYATATVAQEPLLCIGKDFPLTDLELVDIWTEL